MHKKCKKLNIFERRKAQVMQPTDRSNKRTSNFYIFSFTCFTADIAAPPKATIARSQHFNNFLLRLKINMRHDNDKYERRYKLLNI